MARDENKKEKRVEEKKLLKEKLEGKEKKISRGASAAVAAAS